MVDPDHGEHPPEQLAGGEGPRVQWAAIAVVVVLVAGAVLLARAAHHDTRPSAAHRETVPPGPVPTASSTKPAVHVGTVYLEHLDQCTQTDHRHHLSVALGVTNLGHRSLVLLRVTPVTSDASLVQPNDVHIGKRGCAITSPDDTVRLAPGAAAVVNLGFRVGPGCPRHALVSAQVSFDSGAAGIVHADSSQLANLDRLNFVQCA